jgi:hypothetical protein
MGFNGSNGARAGVECFAEPDPKEIKFQTNLIALPHPSDPDCVSLANGFGPGASPLVRREVFLGSWSATSATRRAKRGPTQREDVFRQKH